jgi:hypothetical protein
MLWRFMTPWKPRPLTVPIHELAGGELLDGDDVADLRLDGGGLADLVEVAVGGDSGLAEVAHLAVGEAALLLRAEGDLDGVVAVLLLRLDLGHGAGARLDDGHGHEDVVPVVDLGHADFLSE